jgi:hypothetical protein
MQHYIVALITDAAPHGIVTAVRTLMDFCYLLQATTINETHCQKILGALKEFHEPTSCVIQHMLPISTKGLMLWYPDHSNTTGHKREMSTSGQRGENLTRQISSPYIARPIKKH